MTHTYAITPLVILFFFPQYLYLVLKDQSRLPPEGLAMIRYHSFYPYVISPSFLINRILRHLIVGIAMARTLTLPIRKIEKYWKPFGRLIHTIFTAKATCDVIPSSSGPITKA